MEKNNTRKRRYICSKFVLCGWDGCPHSKPHTLSGTLLYYKMDCRKQKCGGLGLDGVCIPYKESEEKK